MVTSELFGTIKTAFTEEGWQFVEVPDREVIEAGFEAHHTRVRIHAQAFPQLPAISVVAESPLATSDPVKRERLAELTMRINRTLTVGNFELDWDAGRILFRATNLFSSPQGDPGIVKGLVHNTIGEMDRAAPLEMIIHRTENSQLGGLSLVDLLRRDDLLPDVPVEEDSQA